MMNKKVLILLALIFTGRISAKSFIQWKEIPSPTFLAPRFVKIVSQNDFWILDESGILFHFAKGKWSRYPIPEKNNFVQFEAANLQGNNFIIAAYKYNWESRIFYFKNYKWSKDTLRLKNPIKYIKVFKDGDVYIAGDWAAFYHLIINKWEKITPPFHSQSIFFVRSENEIWFGTRGNGIYKFNGKNFQKFKIEDFKGFEISRIDTLNGRLFFKTSNNLTFVLKDSIFIRAEINIKPKVRKYLGFSRIESKTNIEVILPDVIGLRYFNELSPGKFLIISQKNKIYKSQIINYPVFYESAEAYHLKGNATDVKIGAAFFYLNHDALPDLFELIKGYNIFTSFYLNGKEKPFNNVAKNLFFPNKSFLLFAIADFNSDFNPDFATISFNKRGAVLRTFLNDGKNKLILADTILLPEYYGLKPLKELYPLDFTGNGKIDLGISTYFGKNFSSGSQIFIENSGFNVPSALDTNFNQISRGWGKHVIFADFNNDGLNDLLLVNQWGKFKLLLQNKNSSAKFSLKFLPTKDSAAALTAAAFDFDNDGDLDILYSSDYFPLRILVNDGKGNFSAKSIFFGADDLLKNPIGFNIDRSICVGDFNNDGFQDFFFAIRRKNFPIYFFENRKGKRFIGFRNRLLPDSVLIARMITGDIDADGDLDLFAYSVRKNFLWLNSFNSKNFLEIIPVGVISNTDGLGAKVFVYSQGHLNDRKYLLGFRQLGSANSSANTYNQLLAHFGVQPNKKYDVKIQFYRGRTKFLQSVSAGSIIKVEELSGWRKSLYLFPGVLMRFLLRRETQYYLLILLSAVLLMFFSVRFGLSTGYWTTGFVAFHIAINLSLFWLLIFLNNNSTSFFFKYFLPLIIFTAGMFLPVAYTEFWAKSSTSKKREEELENDLLHNLLLLEHGEWASKNLTGILLLMNNPPENQDEWENFQKLLNKRLINFKQFTMPIFNKILQIAEQVKAVESDVVPLKLSCEILKNEAFNNNSLSKKELTRLARYFVSLKSSIKSIRGDLLKIISSNPEDVTLRIVSEFEEELNKKGIKVEVLKNYDNQIKVIIREKDLAFILANVIQNSVKAIRKGEGKIKIILLKKSPGLQIHVEDNGEGIRNDLLEKIFEKGFSNFGSSGQGLFESREIINKYHGRIFVKESKPAIGTVMVIQLKEID